MYFIGVFQLSKGNSTIFYRSVGLFLHHRSYDTLQAYNEDKGAIEELCKLHSSDAMLHSWYVLAKYLADSVGTVVKFLALLVISSIVYIYNVEHNTVDEYCHRTVIFLT